MQLYYFNTKINFFEPLIEQTYLNLSMIKDDLNKELKMKVDNKSPMNINFSVSFYDTVFTLIHALNDE